MLLAGILSTSSSFLPRTRSECSRHSRRSARSAHASRATAFGGTAGVDRRTFERSNRDRLSFRARSSATSTASSAICLSCSGSAPRPRPDANPSACPASATAAVKRFGKRLAFHGYRGVYACIHAPTPTRFCGRYGFPSHRAGDIDVVSYVFNGDFVDRGPHQLEVARPHRRVPGLRRICAHICTGAGRLALTGDHPAAGAQSVLSGEGVADAWQPRGEGDKRFHSDCGCGHRGCGHRWLWSAHRFTVG